MPININDDHEGRIFIQVHSEEGVDDPFRESQMCDIYGQKLYHKNDFFLYNWS